MASPTLRIGIIATRLGGTDGVSLEADTWARTLRALGHEVHLFTGLAERPLERCRIVPRAFFGHPDVAAINAAVFGASASGTEPIEAARRAVAAMARELRCELERFTEASDVDLLIAENTLSLPVHLPLGLAIVRLADERGLPVLAHHHDLPWERSRFTPNAVVDILDEAFPPRSRHIHHVCINSGQRAELERRLGRPARVIPNIIEVDEATAAGTRTLELRQALGLAENELLVLQPTRVVPRKGIEHALELVRRLECPAVLVVTGAAGDEGHDYGSHLRALARLLEVRVAWAAELIAAESRSVPSGRGMFSLDEAFAAADLVTYPSLVEGFGRALLAAGRHRRPVVVNRYPVYDLDIRPLGFRAVEMQGFVSEATVAGVRAILDDAALQTDWADHNEQLVRRHFSTAVLRRELGAALAEVSVVRR